MRLEQTIKWKPFSTKHINYMKECFKNFFNVAEGAIRAGKTIDHCLVASIFIENSPDKLHLASGSTLANAKLNIGACNGFGLENLFRGRCKWGKYKDNEALFINTHTGDEKIVIFAGGGQADSYKKILGNSYGLWIATEINLHYDSEESETSFIKVAMGRQLASEKRMILWDLNPSMPTHSIYEKYVDYYLENELIGGYNYCHFTIEDNLSVSEERKKAIISQYDINSIWYKRDILGMRVVAEGLVFEYLANDRKKYTISKEEVNQLGWREIHLGVDIGGNESKSVITATGYSSNGVMVQLESRALEHKGVVDPQMIFEMIEEFYLIMKEKYIVPRVIWFESAEQVIKVGLTKHMKYKGYGIVVKNCVKTKAKERITLYNFLYHTDKMKIHEDNHLVYNSLSTVLYDRKQDCAWIDNGTTDIDTFDADYYSFSGNAKNLMKGRY